MGRLCGRVQRPRLLGHGVEEFYTDGTPHTPQLRATTPKTSEPSPNAMPPPCSPSLLSVDMVPQPSAVSPTVLLLGATSYVGAHIVVELLNRGYSVRVLAHEANIEERERLSSLHVLAPHRLAFFNADIQHAVVGCPYIVLADVDQSDSSPCLVAAMLLAVHRYGTPHRIVVVSSATALLELRAAERCGVDFLSAGAMALIQVRRLAFSLELPVVVLLPSMLVGPSLSSPKEFRETTEVLRRWRQDVSIVERAWRGQERYALVDVRDVALAISAALPHAQSYHGELYLLVGEEVGPADLHKAMCEADETERSTRGMWRCMLSSLIGLLSRGGPPAVGWTRLCQSADVPSPLGSDKIARKLGVGLRDIGEALRESARELVQRSPSSHSNVDTCRWWTGAIGIGAAATGGCLLWGSRRMCR